MSGRAVPLRTKALYGVGEAAISLKNASLNQYLLFFYADVMQLNPMLVAVALGIGKLWDAVIDPAMGYWSDTTRSNWGRRRPYVLLSALPMGIFYYLLYSPPPLQGTALFFYLLLVSIVMYTFFTAFAVPYLAWGAELAEDYHERTEVVQVRALFGVLGGAAGATLQHAESREGFSERAVVLALLVGVTALFSGLFVRDPGREQLPAASFAHFRDGMRRTFQNREFAITFTTFCLMTVAISLGQGLQLYVVKYWLELNQYFPWIVATFVLSLTVSFPFWLKLSHRIGKRRALRCGLALGVVAPFGWVLVQPGELTAMLVFMVVGGAVSGSLPLAMSLATDVVDLDELRTGEQRAGAYFGIWAFGLKFMGALGAILGGVLLSGVGYDAKLAVQDPQAIWWLVLVVGPLQSVVNAAGLWALGRMQFDEHHVREVQAELAARRTAA